MRILLTNDDGIGALGIQALWQVLTDIADVYVVAPDIENSAMSQAITVHQPIRLDEYLLDGPVIKAWKIGGTPTDCVKIALEALLVDNMPDIIVSGINHGPNLGTDILYSGTVSAAIEAALHGLPAIAVSLDAYANYNFTVAARFIKKLVLEVVSHSLPLNTLLNVNVPALPATEITGVAVTKLGFRQYENTFERREDPRGRSYYWMGGNVFEADNAEDNDVNAVKQGKIAVTPIHFDLTNYPLIHTIADWKLNL